MSSGLKIQHKAAFYDKYLELLGKYAQPTIYFIYKEPDIQIH